LPHTHAGKGGEFDEDDVSDMQPLGCGATTIFFVCNRFFFWVYAQFCSATAKQGTYETSWASSLSKVESSE
jgi:hypothetical protein